MPIKMYNKDEKCDIIKKRNMNDKTLMQKITALKGAPCSLNRLCVKC